MTDGAWLIPVTFLFIIAASLLVSSIVSRDMKKLEKPPTTKTREEHDKEIVDYFVEYRRAVDKIMAAYTSDETTAKEPVREDRDVPKPGGWNASDQSNLPPYITYNEEGKDKVTYRGEDLYNQILGMKG